MPEEKKGVVRTRMAGLNYDLFFTDSRIVAAKTGSTGGWALALGAIGHAIAIHLSNKRSEQLRDVTIESIEHADKKNFFIRYDDILRAELRKPKALSLAKLIVETTRKKYTFLCVDKKHFIADNDTIQSTIGSKIQSE